MPAQQFTPGAIDHFVQFRNSPSIFYLGTAVIAPEPEGEKFKIPIMNDLAGRSVPFQLVQDGEIWMISTTINRFDLQVARAIRQLESGIPPVIPGNNFIALGSETAFARGTLVIGISDFVLYLVNRYANTTAAGSGGLLGAGADLESNRGWSTCNLRKYKESTAGTRVKEIAMAIECQNIYFPSGVGAGTFRAYAESIAPLSGATPN